jgi:hypothetical protein
MKVNWKAVEHPTVISTDWSLLVPDSRGTRKGIRINNESLLVNCRIAQQLTVPGSSDTTAGLILFAGGDGTITEDYDGIYTGPIWGRNASGSAKEIAVQEGF